ncbi:MAG: site-specific DNA-methyltransferase [Prevotella sp.]
MNKAELRKKIKDLDGLTNEEKAALLELLNKQKKYGLVWEEKPEDVEERLRDSLPVFKEVKERAILSDSPDAPNHILIEGDNLEALTALSYTHEDKIDIIYIDPPYNRGDKDFKYNDDYIDKENPFKHSKWLCFMHKRLIIAKKLLKQNGVMIVHIDEHEFDALNLLLRTEIFSENNNLGLIVWNKMNPKGDAKNVAVMHEYILVFCKNKEMFIQDNESLMREKANANKIISKASRLFARRGNKDIPEDVKSVLSAYNYPKELFKNFQIDYDFAQITNEFQLWLKKSDFAKGEKAYKYIDKNGEVFRTVSMAWPNKDKAPEEYWIPLFHPITGEKCPMPSKGWRYPQATMKKMLGTSECEIYDNMVVKGCIAFTTNKNGKCNIPERVYYLKDNKMENVPSIYNDGSSSENLLYDMNIEFPYPKSINVATYLIKNILRNKNATILDFFAGSGTTLHATTIVNMQDGGKRKCIIVTNNENQICDEVTYIRSKKAINGYTTPKGEQVEGLKNNSLRYYKTELLPREKSPRNMRALMAAATELLCIKEDLYEENRRFGRYRLNPKAARYFEKGERRMLIVYCEELADQIAEEIKTLDFGGKRLKIYIFSPDRYAFDDNFYEVESKVQLVALPAAIYDAYRRVLPKKRDKVLLEDSAGETPTPPVPTSPVEQSLELNFE